MLKTYHRFAFYFLLLLLFSAAAAKAQPQTELKELAGYKYKQQLVNTDKAEARLPIVIGIHWSTSTPDEFAQYLTGIKKPARLILLQGQYPKRAGFSYFPSEPKNYYDLPADEKMSVLLQEAEKLSRFIEEITKLYNPSKKPFIIGASQGGDLSYVTAIRYSHLISRAFPLLATMDNRIIAKAPKSSVPIDVFHGTADPIVSFATVQEHVRMLEKNGYKVKLHSYKDIKHDISDQMQNDYIELINKKLD